MKRISTRFIAAAALALGAFGAATAAHAGRGEWHVTVGVQPASSYYVQPESVYVQPRTVYTQPRPVYVQPAPYGYSRNDGWDDRRWQRHGPYGDRDRDGIANVYERGGSRHPGSARGYGPHGDFDRDGVRNRRDRDLDGDGVRNRRDRAPRNPYRY